MGREIRRVPANWQHPKKNNHHIPLKDHYNRDVMEWDEGAAKWTDGLRSDWNGGWKPGDEEDKALGYAEYSGERPQMQDYMPDWPETERTHLMMYENISEGTPLSPAFDTPEELARWLTDNNASALGSMTATYDQWLATCKQGWALSAVMFVHSDGTNSMTSGVAAAAED